VRMTRDLAALCPAVPEVQSYFKQLTEKFIRDWGFDGSKLDNIYSVPACYNPAHHHKSPQDSVNAMGDVYKEIFQTTRALKPESVTQSCPCGTPPSLAWLPFMDQAVTADPVGAEQVRRLNRVYAVLSGINGVILRLPPLRDRKEDIPDLLECFLVKHANELKKNTPELSRDDRKLLFAYDWPGNIRELENVARKIVAVGDAGLALGDLRISRVPQGIGEGVSVSSLKVAARAASRRTERELILKALEQTHWNRKRAARDLQISYKSLLYKIKQIGAAVPVPSKGEGKS